MESKSNQENKATRPPNQGSTQFVNEGLKRWEAIRAEWLRPQPGKTRKVNQDYPYEIDADDIVERIFSQNGGWELAHPVPLPQMVDILIDFWDSEGLHE